MCRSDPNAPPWNPLLFVGIGLTAFTDYRRFFFGGEVLLIDFILCILLLVPMIFIQLNLGGLVQKSVFGLFHSSLPVLRGAAVALLVRLFIFGTYMPALAVHSICAGFATVSSERQLMTSCANAWNTGRCYEPSSGSTAGDNNTVPLHARRSPVTEYIQNHFYQDSGTVDDLGGFPDFPTFPLVLLLTWSFIFLLVAFGPRVFAWAVSLMGLVSSVIMIGVLVHGWSMDLVRHGIESPAAYRYAFTCSNMGEVRYWMFGLVQVSSVTYVSIGILPTMAKFTGKGRVSTKLLWFVVVFLYLVFRHLPVLTIAPYQFAAEQEQGVIFIGYLTLSINVEPAAEIFVYSGAHPAASFFYFLAGYIHDVAQLALFVLVILDNFFDAFEGWTFSSDSKRRVSWIIANAVLCAILFLLGLPYMTRGGMSLLWFFHFSTGTLYPIAWYCAGLGLLAIYVRQKTAKFVERIILGVWVILAILTWTVLELYVQASARWGLVVGLLNPLPLYSRSTWFSVYWLTGVFPVVVTVIGVFVFVMQRIRSRNIARQQPESRDIENCLSAGNDETDNTQGRDNPAIESRC